jgi:hypothetical protein
MMDELSREAKVHLSYNYKHVIREIENLEQFYEAKVLAADSLFDTKVYNVRFGTDKVPVGPRGILMHPLGPDGTRFDGESESSDKSWCF